MEKKMIIGIMAGNFKEYKNFIDKKNLKKSVFKYLYHNEIIKELGLTGSIILGTFWQRKDSTKIFGEVQKILNKKNGKKRL